MPSKSGPKNPKLARKFPPEHYRKLVAARQAVRPPLDVRFWRMVTKIEGGCWLWQGRPKRDGYGQFWNGKRPQYAHRVALDLLGIVVPDGMVADHICRNRLCVNPEHLRIVTPYVNATQNNDSPLAQNARKTHCKYGHPLSGDNVRVVTTPGPRGSPCTARICLKCYGPGGERRGKSARTNQESHK